MIHIPDKTRLRRSYRLGRDTVAALERLHNVYPNYTYTDLVEYAILNLMAAECRPPYEQVVPASTSCIIHDDI